MMISPITLWRQAEQAGEQAADHGADNADQQVDQQVLLASQDVRASAPAIRPTPEK